MAVYLDTNVLVQKAGFDSLELSTAVAVCREAGAHLIVPRLVADEVESARLRAIEGAFDALVAAHREATRLAPIALLAELPNPGELAREFRHQLEQQMSVVDASPEVAAEALRREAFRRRPARGGRGARDAAIWLTARDDHLGRTETGYFVTQNFRDFGEPGSEELHHDLVAELATHDHPMVLCQSLAELMTALAEPVEPFLSDDEIGGLEPFSRAVIRLLHDAAFLELVRPPEELGAGPDARLFAGSAVRVSFSRVLQRRGLRVAERRISIARLEWDLAFELGTLEKAGFGRTQRSVPVVCRVIGLVWIGEGLSGSEHSVEIAQVSSTDTVAT